VKPRGAREGELMAGNKGATKRKSARQKQAGRAHARTPRRGATNGSMSERLPGINFDSARRRRPLQPVGLISVSEAVLSASSRPDCRRCPRLISPSRPAFSWASWLPGSTSSDLWPCQSPFHDDRRCRAPTVLQRATGEERKPRKPLDAVVRCPADDRLSIAAIPVRYASASESATSRAAESLTRLHCD